MNPLFQGGFLRPNEQGNSYGTQFGLPINSMHAPGLGRFDIIQSGAPQAGDMVLAQGMQAPAPQEGGTWVFSGSNMVGGRGSSGDDDFMAPDQQQSQWIFQPQQQAAPQQAPQQQGPRPDVPAQLPIYDDWDAYRQMARAQTEGLNRMPFVFADSQKVPTDKQDAFSMFYPANLQGWQNQMRNPLFESDVPPLGLEGVGTSSKPNPTQGFGSPFTNPMFR
jgi:hypothetical protein